jgi:hypothetical protein
VIDRRRVANGLRRLRGDATARADGTTIVLDYPPNSVNEPRWGRKRPVHTRLAALLDEREADFAASLEMIAGYQPDLAALTPIGGMNPMWGGEHFGGLDGAALYSYLRARDPRIYVEIGSGQSTRFAAAAKRDGGLRTHIVSIDPNPRQEIDALCDTSLRVPLEEADLGVFRSLVEGDMVFLDGSHRVFMNSDAVVFLLEILPDLAPGVIAGVHDIFLPDDYPIEWASRYYSEQYVLAAWLLAGGDRIAPVLAAHYMCCAPSLKGRWLAIWEAIAQADGYGSSLWLERRGR